MKSLVGLFSPASVNKSQMIVISCIKLWEMGWLYTFEDLTRPLGNSSFASDHRLGWLMRSIPATFSNARRSVEHCSLTLNPLDQKAALTQPSINLKLNQATFTVLQQNLSNNQQSLSNNGLYSVVFLGHIGNPQDRKKTSPYSGLIISIYWEVEHTVILDTWHISI